MRYLFIVHDVYQDFNDLPLGPAYLASVLRKENHSVDVYSMDVFHYTLKDLAEYLKKREYDIIGVGFLSARFRETIIPLCKVINKYKKRAKLILGGHGASASPQYMLEKTKADGVVIGEAESVISSVYDSIENGENIIYGVPIKKLDEIPFPSWDKFPMETYLTCKKYPGAKPNEKAINMITSRGCPNRCTFCYRMHKGVRFRSIPNIIEEMKLLKDNYGATYFNFADECFLTSKKRLEDVYCSLQDNDMNISYFCQARVDLITEDVLELMKLSGCKFINYGFEASDDEVLKLMRKNTTVEQNINAAKLTKDAGINFGLNVIWNNLGDTIDSLWKNVEFLKEYNVYSQPRTIRPATPYPGSYLYKYAIEKGLLKDEDDFFDRFKNSDLITVNFTDVDINVMYRELFKANKDLLYDHYKHTNMSHSQYKNRVDGFESLYFEGNVKFRGVRKYDKK